MFSKLLKMGACASLVFSCAVSNAETIEGDLNLEGSLVVKGKSNSIYNGLVVNTGNLIYNSIRLTADDGWAMISAYGYNNYDPMGFQANKYNFKTGNVGIGIEDPKAKLHVNGAIICTGSLDVADVNTNSINSSSIQASQIKANDIRMDMNNVADYVFDENYDLKSLSEVENYVNEHKHLPGVPSAAEMEAEGISVSQMSNILLEKVEELTLHMIQLQKENAQLKQEMENMKNNVK
ncbi:MAG: hypothetical protein U0K66_04840 [Paludibacteraceae bacterium]|jgi:hypothetical protein|nr:hypothetical protein [Paludibacteraceae bacterium]